MYVCMYIIHEQHVVKLISFNSETEKDSSCGDTSSYIYNYFPDQLLRKVLLLMPDI